MKYIECADVGLLTWHYYSNVGSNLQAYAVQTIIQQLGYTTAFINYRGEHKENLMKKGVRECLSKIAQIFPLIIPESLRAEAYRFQQDCFAMTKPVYGKDALLQYAHSFQMYLCGSDQIWAPNVLNDVYLFSFLKDGQKRCSYAASIGLPNIPCEKDVLYQKYLKQFHRITVREEQGCSLLKSRYGIDATCVLDPTLLLTKHDWESIAHYSKRGKKYIFAYFLGKTMEHRKWLRKLQMMTGYDVVLLSDDPSENHSDWLVHHRIGPKRFVGYVSQAEFILTDSFHGMAFSINYEKPFYIVPRFKQEDIINQNSRVTNLLKIFDINNQLLIAEPDSLPKIDYESIRTKLKSERFRCLEIMENMLDECLQ